MNRDLLLKAFGDIDETYIAEACRTFSEAFPEPAEKIVRLKKRRILTLALAAALLMVFGIAAYSAGRSFFGWGGNMEIRSVKTDHGIENTVIVHTESLTEPVVLENGRMIFIVNGEQIDITDQVSETRPYIYHYTDEEGIAHYWIIGKNGPEAGHYGYAEYLQPSDGEWTAGYVARTDNNEAPWLYQAWDELGFDFQKNS